MSESEWTDVASPSYMTDLMAGPNPANFAQPTATLDMPNGAEDRYVYAWRSTAIPEPPDPQENVMAQRNVEGPFSPVAATLEVEVSGALFRRPDADAEMFSVFLFVNLQTDDVLDTGYMVGLSAGQPGHIVLAIATLDAGLPFVEDDSEGNPPVFPLAYTGGDVLARSTDTVALGEWIHLRLTVAPAGPVDVLSVYQNDLETNGLLKPVWVLVASATHSPGLAGGFAGFGVQHTASGVVAAADHIVLGKTS